jgi:XTP/dITP diphosphohydrolase
MTYSTEQLLRLAEVMDRLRSPGGCPWDAEQSHESLLKYLLEEAYEYIEAVESGDADAMKEELGDLLLQVYFHARIAEERSDKPFNVNDVAEGVAEKLINRHPHVFGEASAKTSDEVKQNWEAIKNAEKTRTSVIDGVPLGQPALPLAAKLIHRAGKNGVELPHYEWQDIQQEIQRGEVSEKSVGDALMAIVELADKNNIDPESALRSAALSYAEKLRNSSPK